MAWIRNTQWLWIKSALLDLASTYSSPDLVTCLREWLPLGSASVPRRKGVTPGNLRLLSRAWFSPNVIPPPKMALINARSLMNKTFLSCRSVPVNVFTSFEAQLLRLNWNGPVLLWVNYRPPHFQQLTEPIGSIATNYDCFLLVGDFNIHICCQSNLLSKEFLNLNDSFNLVQ